MLLGLIEDSSDHRIFILYFHKGLLKTVCCEGQGDFHGCLSEAESITGSVNQAAHGQIDKQAFSATK